MLNFPHSLARNPHNRAQRTLPSGQNFNILFTFVWKMFRISMFCSCSFNFFHFLKKCSHFPKMSAFHYFPEFLKCHFFHILSKNKINVILLKKHSLFFKLFVLSTNVQFSKKCSCFKKLFGIYLFFWIFWFLFVFSNNVHNKKCAQNWKNARIFRKCLAISKNVLCFGINVQNFFKMFLLSIFFEKLFLNNIYIFWISLNSKFVRVVQTIVRFSNITRFSKKSRKRYKKP